MDHQELMDLQEPQEPKVLLGYLVVKEK